MNSITKNFIASIDGKPEHEYIISTKCEYYNGTIFATLLIAQEFAKDLKRSGYNTMVIDNSTGEILFEA